MDKWKSRGGKSQRREEKNREKDQRRERVRRKKMQVREKVEKVVVHGVFPMICGSGGSKSKLAKAAGEEPSGHCGAKHISISTCTKHVSFGALLASEMSKECTALWCEANFGVKM